MNKVNHKMIQLARESRGYSQTELAELTGIPQGNLSRIERGDIGLSGENLSKLISTLQYPADFFYQENKITTTDTHYRKSIAIDQKTKLKAEAIMNIYKFNVEEMLKSLEVSTSNIPILSEQHDSPEKVAKFLRSYWKVEKGPINDLSKIIEDNGVIVIQIDFETDKIDGRTIITATGQPIIFPNKNSSGDRQRLTLAHELGHVILHISTLALFKRDEEDEAFRFAIEFLMPLSECQYDLDNKLSIEKLADLKRVWKISMQAILYRAQKQKLVTENRGRYLWSQFTARGWRKDEPISIAKEYPTLLSRMVNMFLSELKYSKKELSHIFKINTNEFEERYLIPKANKLRVA